MKCRFLFNGQQPTTNIHRRIAIDVNRFHIRPENRKVHNYVYFMPHTFVRSNRLKNAFIVAQLTTVGEKSWLTPHENERQLY